MNFKPTTSKVITSIILALITNFFGMQFLAGCSLGFFGCYFQGLRKVWFAWFPVLILIYTFWSLIEKE